MTLIVLFTPILIYADSWTSSQPSHSTLYADTLTSKTDASPVNVADAQGLFVTGDITTLGKVGIGTTGPGNKLDVRGGGINIDYTSGTQSIGIGSFATAGKRISTGYKMTEDYAYTDVYNDAGAAYLNYRINALNLILNDGSSGNVGIGTTNPSEKLEVAGNIKAENLGKVIWSTSTSGTYSLRTIFDSARSSGLVPGVYDCAIRTSNNAHWTGRRFTATVNYYINSPSYPHRFYNVIDINAGSSGCSGGLTSFTDATGDFTFDSGNCFQSIGLVCNRLY